MSKILIIESDFTKGNILGELLQLQGHEVTVAADENSLLPTAIQWLAKWPSPAYSREPSVQVDLPAIPPSPAQPKPAMAGTFLAKLHGRKFLVKLSEVKVILAQGEFSEVVWGDQNERIKFRKPLKVWIKELANPPFIRVHRQAIINLHFLDYVSRNEAGKSQVHLQNFPRVLEVSQRKIAGLNRALKNWGKLF